MCCRLENFCCCCSLRTGAIIVAIWSLLCAGMGFGPGAYILIKGKDSLKNSILEYPQLETKDQMISAIYNKSLEEARKEPNATVDEKALHDLAEVDGEIEFTLKEVLDIVLNYASYIFFGFGGVAFMIFFFLIVAICTETACCVVPWLVGAIIDMLLLATLIGLFAYIKFWYIFVLLIPLFFKLYVACAMCSYMTELSEGGTYRIRK